METDSEILLAKEFPVSTTKGNVILLNIGFGFMVVAGLLLTLRAATDGLKEPGLLFLGIFGCTLGLLYFFSLVYTSRGVKYYVGKRKISLFRRKELIVDYNEIETVSELSAAEAGEAIKLILNNAKQVQRDLGLVEAVKKDLETYGQLNFLSVPYSCSGGEDYNDYDKVSIPCPCVAIKLKSGKTYYISPQDSSAFVNEVKKQAAWVE